MLRETEVFAVLIWGILISEISTRDVGCETHQMSAALPGGTHRRYLRHFLATFLLGLLFTMTLQVRLMAENPLACMTLISGLLMLSSLASCLGYSARTSRAFVTVLLFGLKFSSEMQEVAAWDVLGAQQSATWQSTLMQMLVASLLFAMVIMHQRWRAKA